MGMTRSEDEWVGPKDLAKSWGLPERTLSQWRYLGKGPRYFKFGKHIRYRRADCEAWAEEQADPRSAA
jgi:hypothetical protein